MLVSINSHPTQTARSHMHTPQQYLMCEAKHLQENVLTVHVCVEFLIMKLVSISLM